MAELRSGRGPMVVMAVIASLGAAARDAPAQDTERASVDSSENQGAGGSILPSISRSGRFVAFESEAALVAEDTNGVTDVYRRDRMNGSTLRVSLGPNGVQGNGPSEDPWISADGRLVAFGSRADNLVSGDTNQTEDLFVRDVQAGTTRRVSVHSSGAQAGGGSWPAISPDGDHVSFVSLADDLVNDDFNGIQDLFVHHLPTGTTTRVSQGASGTGGDGPSYGPAPFSKDGQFVVFSSSAGNLVAGDLDGHDDVFRYDARDGVVELVSRASDGTQGDEDSHRPSLSWDGRWVAFRSFATNLVSDDTNGWYDVFVRDTQLGVTTRVSVDSAGGEAAWGGMNPSLSADGSRVAFVSSSEDLVPGDTNASSDVFQRDRTSGVTTRVSIGWLGQEGAATSSAAAMAGDGHAVAFTSFAENLVPDDTNGEADVFVRGPSLYLEVEGRMFYAYDPFEFDVYRGRHRDPALLYLVSFDGQPFSWLLVVGSYDKAGIFRFRGNVPDGLGWLDLGFMGIGLTIDGEVALTNVVELQFR